MRVLGIESSCDETGVALYDSENGLLAQALYSQIDLHTAYGGVVPELASRDHVRKLLPLVRQTLAEADLKVSDIDAVAFTAGPGLIGADNGPKNLLLMPHRLAQLSIVIFCQNPLEASACRR